MRYMRLKPYGELERLGGRPTNPATPCKVCGRVKGRGDTALRVRFVDPPPYPDALGVLFGPEWAVSKAMRAVLDSTVSGLQYADIVGEDGQPIPFDQVLLADALQAGRESNHGGDECEECGGYVQLGLDPLFLRRPESSSAPLAYLRESPGVVLIREDLADALRAASLDIDLTPAFFEGEQVSRSGSLTLPGESDWSDLGSL